MNPIRQRNADAGEVLMVTGALDLYRLVIQQDALVRIEADGADAKCGLVFVHGIAVGFDHGDCSV